MTVAFTESAWADDLWFQDHDRTLVKRINLLIRDALRTPFDGIAKPEPLRADLSGYRSRRIDEEHRLVYLSGESGLIIVACRYHHGQ